MKPLLNRDGARTEWIGETPVYRIDFCKECLAAYEASLKPEEPGS